MAKNQVIIDWSKAVRDARKAGKDIQTVFQKPINQVFNFESVKRFRTSNIDAYAQLQKGADAAKKELSFLKSLLEQVKDSSSDVGVSLKEGIEDATTALAKFNQEQQKLIRTSSRANYLQRVGGRMMTAAHAAGRPEGMRGQLGQGIGGVGDAMAAAAESPLGLLAGGAAALYGGATALTAPRRRMAGTNLQFMGLSKDRWGRSDLENMSLGGQNYGFDREETMQQAIMLQRSAGDVTKGGVGRQNMASFASMQRSTGMDAGEVASMVAAQRAAATTPGGAELTGNLQKTAKLIEQGFKSAIGTSGALRYWQITSEMTKNLADNGTADPQAIANALSSLTKGNAFFGANPNRAAAGIQGVDQFFRSEQGTGMALRALQDSKVTKGMDLGQILMTQKMGLFSGQTQWSGGRIGVGGKFGPMDFLRSQAQQMGLNKRNWMSPENRQAKNMLAAGLSEANNVTPQVMVKMLDQAMGVKGAKGPTEKEMEAMRSANEIMSSMDGKMENSRALLNNLVYKGGEIIGPMLTSINHAVLGIASRLLVDTKPAMSKHDAEAALANTRKGMQKGYGVGDYIMDKLGMGPLSNEAKQQQLVATTNLKEGGAASSADIQTSLGMDPADFPKKLAAAQADFQGFDNHHTMANESMMSGAKTAISDLQDDIAARKHAAEDPDNHINVKTDPTLKNESALLGKLEAFVTALQDIIDGTVKKPIVSQDDPN